jgi:hypothetical protein
MKMAFREAVEKYGIPQRTLRRAVADGSVEFTQPSGPGGKVYLTDEALETAFGALCPRCRQATAKPDDTPSMEVGTSLQA